VRVLVCGGRDYSDHELVCMVLDRIHAETPIDIVIHGGARGADSLAHAWAVDRRVAVVEVKANWKAHGRAAGPIRNQDMLDRWEPSMVLAFPGGRGTADMVDRARKAGVYVEHAARLPGEASRALREDVQRNGLPVPRQGEGTGEGT
jgi:hypothetical protein